MLEKHLEKLRPMVMELFEKDSSGHDASHLERTMAAALYLQEREGGDRTVIGIAALLHDVHRIMEHDAGRFVSPEESIAPIREMLAGTDLTEGQIDRICYCVEHHEHYNWNGDNVEDWNTLVLQDADNLDALGALGIARAFAYGGAHGIALYDPSVPLGGRDDYAESDRPSASMLHFLFDKSFKLVENMNTETGRELAQRKIDYMRDFADRFLNEWDARF